MSTRRVFTRDLRIEAVKLAVKCGVLPNVAGSLIGLACVSLAITGCVPYMINVYRPMLEPSLSLTSCGIGAGGIKFYWKYGVEVYVAAVERRASPVMTFALHIPVGTDLRLSASDAILTSSGVVHHESVVLVRQPLSPTRFAAVRTTLKSGDLLSGVSGIADDFEIMLDSPLPDEFDLALPSVEINGQPITRLVIHFAHSVKFGISPLAC
jgi:hypothetical protein